MIAVGSLINTLVKNIVTAIGCIANCIVRMSGLSAPSRHAGTAKD